MKGSDKTDQDFKVGILNEDRKLNTDLEQSGSSPAGTGEARFFFSFLFLYKYIYINGQQRQALIKYSYLQYLCCLLCNPTTRVNQIKDSDTVKYYAQLRQILLAT